jgi:hypothetical protein
LANIIRKIRQVADDSHARCSVLVKFAGVMCSRPSLVSADGDTVAALAVHIPEALYAAARSRGSVAAA